VLDERETLSTGPIARMHAMGAARVHDIGMQWRDTQTMLVDEGMAAAGEMRTMLERTVVLTERVEKLKQELEGFGPEAPLPAGPLSTDGVIDLNALTVDTTRSVAQRALHQDRQRRAEARKRLVDAEDQLQDAREKAKSLPMRIAAARESLVTRHDLAVRDADRHRSFAYELMATYWGANQAARRTWWRRLIRRIRRRPLIALPTMTTPLIPYSEWERTDPARVFEAVRDLLEPAIVEALSLGSQRAVSPDRERLRANA
jgi:hypothetical protein